MGLFSGWKKAGWEKALDRGESALSHGDIAAAHREFTEALRDAPTELQPEVAEKVRRAAERLHAENLAAGRQYADADLLERAAERLELARQFAQTREQKQEVDLALRALRAREAREQVELERGERAADEVEVPDEQAFEILLGALPPDMADRYHDHGPDFRRAFLACHDGRAEQALAWLDGAAKDSGDAILHFERGRALRLLGRNDEARAEYRRAEELDEEWVNVKLALAELCWSEKDWEGAEAVLQRAVDIDDTDENVLLAVAQTALFSGQPGYGLDATEALLDRNPGSRAALLLTGRLHEAGGDRDKAAACYESAVQRGWRYDSQEERLYFDHDAAILAATLYRRSGTRPERAEELYRALMSVVPPSQRWMIEIQIAEVWMRAEKKEQARELLRSVSPRVPASERVARLVVADLLGDSETADGLLGELSDDERTAWQLRSAELRQSP